MTGDLRQLQEWFVHAMTHGENAGAGASLASTLHRLPRLESLLTRSEARTAEERFAVYHHGYRARLLECLVDDYPVLAEALGDGFEGLVHGYLTAHPSRSYSLNGFGRALADYVHTNGPEPRGFFAELATLEWALVEAVHAAGSPVLGLDAVQAVPAAAWEHAVLEPVPSLALHAFEYPVNAFYKRSRQTEATEPPPSLPAPQSGAVAVCRRDAQIWRVDLSPSGYVALRALAEGVPLLPALTAAEARPEDVSSWFRTWMECGFFRAVRQARA